MADSGTFITEDAPIYLSDTLFVAQDKNCRVSVNPLIPAIKKRVRKIGRAEIKTAAAGAHR